MLLPGLDHVAEINKLVVPGIQGSKREVGDLHQIRDDAARDGRDFLLAQRRVGNEAVVDFVATRLFVTGGHAAKSGIFLGDEALGKPYLHSGGRRFGDVRPRQGAGRSEAERTAKG